MRAQPSPKLARRIEIGLLVSGSLLVLPWLVATVSSHRLEADMRRQLAAPAERFPSAEDVAEASPSPGSLIGLVEVPDLGISAPVLEGADAATLFRGAGHIPETALPGTPGNAAIAAHRDSHFRALEHIARHDRIVFRGPAGDYRYEVDDIRLAAPDDLSVLDDRGRASLTLITCYPFRWVGPAPRRFVVQAHLVSITARAPGSPPALTASAPLASR